MKKPGMAGLSYLGLRPGLYFSTLSRSARLICQSRPCFSAGSRPDNISRRTQAVPTPIFSAACTVVKISVAIFSPLWIF